MSILEAYESGEHRSNIAHFAAIVKLAAVDNPINKEEAKILEKLAFKLDISDEEAKEVLKNPDVYPVIPPYTLEERLERLRNLFEIIYADYEIDTEEQSLIFKYAIGLGFSSERANDEIKKYIRIFGGDADFED